MVRREEFIKTHPDVRTGMEAYDSKGQRLGVIERVDDDSITIEKGHIFHHGVSLPYDAIEDIRQDQVIIRRDEGFEEGRMESEEEELERQYERDRSAGEKPFEGEREALYERESAPGVPGPEETRMREGPKTPETLGEGQAGMQEGGWEESQRREPGLEEAAASRQPSASSGELRQEEMKVKPGKSVQKK
jgi:hypothetical protein